MDLGISNFLCALKARNPMLLVLVPIKSLRLPSLQSLKVKSSLVR